MGREQNLSRVGKKISSHTTRNIAGSVLSQCSEKRLSYSSDLKMNHDKKAEAGKKIIREIIKRNSN